MESKTTFWNSTPARKRLLESRNGKACSWNNNHCQANRLNIYPFMTEKETIQASKFLSLILRHEPERVGLQLDEAGWTPVDALLVAVNRHGQTLTIDQLKHIA